MRCKLLYGSVFLLLFFPLVVAAPVLFEDFSTYTDTSNLLANPRGIYAVVEDFRPDRITLDQTLGYGSSSQSMRYNYPAGTSTDYTISRSINGFSPLTELWVEAVIRWSPDFTIQGNGQGYGPAQKLLHVGIAGGPAGRFGVNLEGGSIRAEGPNDDYDDLYLYGVTSVNDLFDGEWHVVRYHVRLGDNDFHEFWVDGVYQGNATGQTGATSLRSIALARNLNMLSDRDMEMWWGSVAVYDEDPGWGGDAPSEPEPPAQGVCEATGAGRCFYIDPVNGDDANDGSFAAPWRTGNNTKATIYPSARPPGVVTLQPGDVIYLMNGVHSTIINPGHDAGPTAGGSFVFYFRGVSGTEQNPITFKAYPGHTPIIQPASQAIGVFIEYGNHWVFDNFTIRGAYSAGFRPADVDGLVVRNLHIYDTDGIDNNNVAGIVANSVTNAVFERLNMHDNFDRLAADTGGIGGENSANIVFFQGGNVTIRDSRFYHTRLNEQYQTCLKYKHGIPRNTDWFEVYNSTFENCRIYGLSTGSPNTYFHHNTIRNGAGIQVQNQGSATGQTVNILIEYNTLYNTSGGLGLVPYTTPTADFPNTPANISYRNNLVYDLRPSYGGEQGILNIGTYISDEVYQMTLPELTIEDNCYYNPFVTPANTRFNFASAVNFGPLGANYLRADWQALGFDTRSVFADPQFVNVAAGNFRLQEGSPCSAMGAFATSESPSEPEPSSTTPAVFEDFSTYTDTAQFLGDPRGVYQVFEDINTNQITIDTTTGYGNSTQSMRYDYPDRTVDGGSNGHCGDYTISRSLRFPNNGDIQEVWVEIVAKTSSDFTTQAPADWGCTSDQGLKFVNGNVNPGDRFSIGLRTGNNSPTSGQLWFGYPNNKVDPVGKVGFSTTGNVVDGEWHRYRCYWRISTGYPGTPNPDGRVTCWVDDMLVVDQDGIITTSTAGNTPPMRFYGLSLGRNINQGPNRPQSLWWGKVAIYDQDPGWNEEVPSEPEPETPPTNETNQTLPSNLVNECATPRAGWLWCDDFETDRLRTPATGGGYYEMDLDGGEFARTPAVGVGGSTAMRALFQAGEMDAGRLNVALGRTPQAYIQPVVGTEGNDYRELYWRVYLKHEPAWTGGGGDKLSRAFIFANSNWAQAAFGHVWSNGAGGEFLAIDPASGTDTVGNLQTTTYNDFANMRWLGLVRSSTPIFASSGIGQWYCIESRMRLNDPGQSNGVFQLWIDGALEAERAGMNWVGSYADYGINAVALENYWNDGSVAEQERYMDNFVISTERIGCGATRRVGDLNNDGVVNIQDVVRIIENFKRRQSYDEGADINEDGTVNVLDMVLLGRNWGGATQPSQGETNWNEPAGFSPVVERRFDTRATTSGRGAGNFPNKTGGSEGWDDIEQAYSVYQSIIQDSTAPTSAPNVLRYTWPAQTVAAGNTFAPGITQTQGFGSVAHGQQNLTRLYHRFTYKFSENYQNHPSGTKIVFHRTNDNPLSGYGIRCEPILGVRGTTVYMNFQGCQDNNRDFGQGTNGLLLPNTPEATQADAENIQFGEWYTFEVLLELNSAYNVSDGRVAVWMKGPQNTQPILIMNQTDLRLIPNPNLGHYWGNIHQGQTWGGQGGTINQDMYTYIDHDYVSGAVS